MEHQLKVFIVSHISLISFSPDFARWSGTRGELAPGHVPPLHDGGLSYLAVDVKVVEGERRQRDNSGGNQFEVASNEREQFLLYS